MAKQICILQGHPHDDPSHFCRALSAAYEDGAIQAGHGVDVIDLGKMEIPFLRDPADFKKEPPAQIIEAQHIVKEADHLYVIYPLWMGSMPALVKAFFEQLSRHEFSIAESEGGWPRKMLKGKSARVVVTMGMPAAAYKIFFGAHGVKSFEGAILGMAGFKPVKETLIGGVGGLSAKQAEKRLARMRSIGARAK
ncbi:MAG: NAD(P)H-dependent oxidoreductase [Marinicaulis sp.]|nr:NAD(P)H-dependent oxidoreductase [Marinicaulis sp.]NNL89619.1 NAD(P)H-dependent oxidoreductase [Marinicaulis sp.]